MTRSPARQPVTSAPTSLTTPASSLPGENGSGGLNWYLFWMMSTSGKLTLAAFTETTTSPAPGHGEGSSSITSDSGGPYCLQRTAFMNIECHMPTITTDDGVRLHFDETGSGTPIVFVHEFGGDLRSWEPQVRYFSRLYRCIAFNARGYPPSEVPEDFNRYSQERARDDIRDVLQGLGIAKAHIVGISMGGFAVLHFGFSYPERASALVVAGCGYGAQPDKRPQFQEETSRTAGQIESRGMAEVAKTYGMGPTRVQYQNKDPRGFAEFFTQLGEHSTRGSANTMRGVQGRRPSLWELTEQMKRLEVPTLVATGDEDDPCLEPGLLMKRMIPAAALVVLPNTGHALNLEEPDLFNQALADFFHQVESGRWPRRDPRAVTGSILGM